MIERLRNLLCQASGNIVMSDGGAERELQAEITKALSCEPPSAAEQLRTLILSLAPETRGETMHSLGVCLHCFDDVRQSDGTDRECYCMRDE